MVSDTTLVCLGDCADILTGFPFKSAEYAAEGLRLLRGDNIIQGSLRWEGVKFWRSDNAASEQYVLSKGDVVLAMDRPWIEAGLKCARIGRADAGALLVQRVARLRAKPNVDESYLYCVIRSEGFTQYILGVQTGTAVPHISKEQIGSFRFLLPEPPQQSAIGELMSSIDNRIEALNTTNGSLEKLARAIFKSWFVDFDPVRAKAEGREPEGMDAATAALFPSAIEESERGEVPQGWNIKRLTDFMEVNPSRILPKGKEAPYLEMANAPTVGPRPAKWADRLPISGCRFRNGDTLLAKITPCLENGKTAFVDFLGEDEVGWGSTEFIVLSPKCPIPPTFGYLLARNSNFRAFAIQSMSGTSGRQRVQVDQLAKFEFPIADGAVYGAFAEIVEPLFVAISHNDDQAKTLAQLRDTLLPRLISGKVRVPEAEKMVEAVV